MPTGEHLCPDCRRLMEAGALIDYRRSSAAPSEWVGSRPDVSIWTGKVKNSPRFEVSAFRCPACGLLRLYADMPASASGNIYG